MARAATTEELALLRSDHQRSILYLAIYKPSVVYSARVNQSTFNDPVTEITFDGGTGTLGNVLVGMTVLVGSSAGADDKGKVYIRKTPGASTFYISPTSEIGWADNDYLTVLDDFELRTKQPSVAGESVYIDWDVTYDDQHKEFDPVAVMGPHAILKLEGSTVNFQPDGSDSWVLGSTISSYLWSAPGASATSNLDTDSPTITYNAAGWYRVSLTVTDANGKTTTGYRRVYVYDQNHLPVENFELVKCIGDYENGGWDFEVNLFDEADIADVYPGALCVLFAEDWYGSTQGSIGPLAGYENLICIGRIDGETIDYDGQLGTVAFVVNGPQGWMQKISSSPAMFTAADDQPSSWSEFASPTVDKALFHLLHWRSNATQIMDVFLSGDTRRLPEIDLDIGYLWEQMEMLAERRMLAKGCCDRFGRLFVEIPGQLLATDDRSGIPTVMAIGKDDWTGKINIESQVPQIGMAELVGILDDTPEQVIMSRAPGSIVKKIGAFESWEGLVFDNQAHANTLAGLFLARENNPYPYVDIELAQNNRMMDVVPNQYVTLSVEPADNPRKITWTNKKLIVKRIDLQHDAKAGMLTTEIECEADTDGPDGVTVYIPPPMLEGETEIELPDFEDYSWPGLTPGNWNFNPPYLPPEPEYEDYGLDCPLDAGENGPWFRSMGGNLNISSSAHPSITFNYNCVLRSGDHTYKSRYEIHGQFLEWDVELNGWKQSDKDDFYNVYALDASGVVVGTGVKDAVTSNVMRSGTFNNAGNKQIKKIMITISESQKLYPELVWTGPSGIYGTVPPATSEQGIWGSGFYVIFTHEINMRGNFGYNPGVKLLGEYPAGTRFSFIETGSIEIHPTDKIAIQKIAGSFAGVKNWESSYDPLFMVYYNESVYTLPIDYLDPGFVYSIYTVGDVYSYYAASTVHYLWCKIAASQEISFSHFKLYNVCPAVE